MPSTIVTVSGLPFRSLIRRRRTDRPRTRPLPASSAIALRQRHVNAVRVPRRKRRRVGGGVVATFNTSFGFPVVASSASRKRRIDTGRGFGHRDLARTSISASDVADRRAESTSLQLGFGGNADVLADAVGDLAVERRPACWRPSASAIRETHAVLVADGVAGLVGAALRRRIKHAARRRDCPTLPVESRRHAAASPGDRQ